MKSYKDYQQMMAHLMRQGYNKGGYVKLKVGGTVGSTPEAKKLIELLDKLKPGDSFNQSDLARKSGASRKLVGDYLKKLYPKLGSGTGRTEKDYSKFKQKVEARDQKVLDQGFLEDYKKKIQTPQGVPTPGLTNKELAKKYYPELTETAGIARLEKLARKIRKEDPKLTYKKISPKEFEQRRKSRLLLTQGGKQFGGTERFPFHHIMPIGGAETDITTKDVTFISKKMNSKLAPFNKKLNGIADGISNNLANYAGTKDDKFLKRVDDLNAQALQIVDKTKKELPKKFQGLIGFNKVTPILDENATLINTSVERIGIDEAKSIVGKKGPKIPLKDLPGTRSRAALLERIKTAQSSGPTLGANIGLLKGVGETIKAIPTPTGAVALNLAFQPDLSSGIDRAALGAEAAFAPELVRQTSRVSSAPIVQRFFNLGLSPQLAARAARVVSPLGLATLAGEGVYQLGRLGAEQRRRMQEMTPEQRRLFDAEQQSISEFAAAGGGIAKLAGKESGPPPEKGPDSEGLASLLKNVKKR